MVAALKHLAELRLSGVLPDLPVQIFVGDYEQPKWWRWHGVGVEVVLAESLRQLPSKSEMESLLTDIHQAAQGRGLQFDLFKPNVSENVFEFYAELPIAIRIEGSYHDLAEFNAALAQLQRIVTVHDMDLSVVPPKATGKSLRDGLAKPTQTMLMTATAKTYRYLDDAEIKEQQKTIAASKRKGKGKK